MQVVQRPVSKHPNARFNSTLEQMLKELTLEKEVWQKLRNFHSWEIDFPKQLILKVCRGKEKKKALREVSKKHFPLVPFSFMKYDQKHIKKLESRERRAE